MSNPFLEKLARRQLFRYGSAGLVGVAALAAHRWLTAERAAEAAAQAPPADGIVS